MRLIQAWFTRAKRDLTELPPSTRLFVLGTIAADVVLAAILALALL